MQILLHRGYQQIGEVDSRLEAKNLDHPAMGGIVIICRDVRDVGGVVRWLSQVVYLYCKA